MTSGTPQASAGSQWPGNVKGSTLSPWTPEFDRLDCWMQGNGKLIFADGTKYIGSFHKDLREGFGSCEYATGERYCGGWKQGQRHGKGRSTTHDGDK